MGRRFGSKSVKREKNKKFWGNFFQEAAFIYREPAIARKRETTKEGT